MEAMNDQSKKVSRPRHEPDGEALLSKSQVTALLGVGETQLWKWMRQEQDAFPLPVELGPPGGRSSTIAWHASEVHQWIANWPRRKLGQHEFRGKRKADTLPAAKKPAKAGAP